MEKECYRSTHQFKPFLSIYMLSQNNFESSLKKKKYKLSTHVFDTALLFTIFEKPEGMEAQGCSRLFIVPPTHTRGLLASPAPVCFRTFQPQPPTTKLCLAVTMAPQP